jgi:hypothetical protein
MPPPTKIVRPVTENENPWRKENVQTEILRSASELNPRKKGRNPGKQETADRVMQT